MNYFERLIRRALLEAPSRPGEALRDPFENEAPLQIDSPVQQLASPWPERTRIAPTPTPVEKRIEIRAQGEIKHETFVLPAPVMPAVPSPVIATPDTKQDVITELHTVQPPPAPLSHADAFMRSLGVVTPEVAVPRASVDVTEIQALQAETPKPIAVADEVRVQPRSPSLPARPHTMQPPLESAPIVRNVTESSRGGNPAASPVERTQTVRQRQREAAPNQSVVRERIHIVKVVEAQSGQSSMLGAAPPTFGAGQL